MVCRYQSPASVLGPGAADAVEGGEQQVVSGGRTGAGFAPQGLQQGEDPGLLGGQPEGSGQAQLAAGSREGQGGGAIFEQGGDLLGVAQIGLVDDAGAAVAAGGLDDVIVELVFLAFGDEGSHDRVIHTTQNRTLSSIIIGYYSQHNGNISRVIHKASKRHPSQRLCFEGLTNQEGSKQSTLAVNYR